MTEPDDARCPGCGAVAASRYCPHCGARTGWGDLFPPLPASQPPAPLLASQLRTSIEDIDPPTVPSMPTVARADPVRAVPEMFSTQFLPVAGPPQAWSQISDQNAPSGAPPSGLFPGWTGMYPAIATAGAVGVLAPRPQRRRKAIYAVLGIAVATVAVLVIALLLAPKWGGTGGSGGVVADKIGPGPVVSSAVASSAVASASTGASTTAAVSPGVAPPVRTVTVTAPTSTAPTSTAATRTAATRTAVPGTSRTTSGVPRTTAKPTPKSTAPALPLGVPQRDIACSAGYVVQLASEIDQTRFAARVAALKAAGKLPSGALAADSTKSCRIFTSQVNTVVLYAGPFTSKYDGCAARLAGPADAYIKGGDADTAGEYVSCLCPASTAGLPRYSSIGQQGVWVGELQRVLGNRLNIEVSDLTANWGKFTAGTQAAVRVFQQSKRLPSNGIVDVRTWSALQSAEC